LAYDENNRFKVVEVSHRTSSSKQATKVRLLHSVRDSHIVFARARARRTSAGARALRISFDRCFVELRPFAFCSQTSWE